MPEGKVPESFFERLKGAAAASDLRHLLLANPFSSSREKTDRQASQHGPSPEEQLSQLSAELQHARRETRLRQKISVAIGRYFIAGHRSPDISIDPASLSSEGKPEWVEQQLTSGSISEPESAALAVFKDPGSTIIDMGANYGYSATSFFNAGVKTCVLSFEPNEKHVACLERIRQLRAASYDFVPIGLSDREADIAFTMPVVDGICLSALMTANPSEACHWVMPENLLNYITTYMPDAADPMIAFTAMKCRVERLDHALRTRKFNVPVDSIAAVKFDVEGHEKEALVGAEETIAAHHPLFYVEGANRLASVNSFLIARGYLYADFEDGHVRLSEALSTRNNGYYLHSDRLHEYRRSGLLVG